MKQWNGEGLPPVGTLCEWRDKTIWTPVEIVFLSKWVIVMRSKADNIGKNVDIAKDLILNIHPEFRMISDINEHLLNYEDERDNAIKDMLDIFKSLKGDVTNLDICEALYDEGWRKNVDI